MTDAQDIDPVETEDDDLIYTAWAIIANAGEGDWSRETPDWRDAAVRWRDRFHARIDARKGNVS